MSPSHSPANEIAQLETRSLNESTTAIMAAVNMHDRASADEFVKATLHRILLQRMISPPDTALLCITLVGSVTAREFVELWHKHLPAEPGMAVFLERMQAADVIHGTKEGKFLEKVSLLKPAGLSSATTSQPVGWLARMKSIFGGRG